MNLTDTLSGVLDVALAGNLTADQRARLTVLWVTEKVNPEWLVEDVLLAASWVLNGPTDDEHEDDEDPVVEVDRDDVIRLRRVAFEARRLDEYLDKPDPLTGAYEFHQLVRGLRDALAAVDHLFPTDPS